MLSQQRPLYANETVGEKNYREKMNGTSSPKMRIWWVLLHTLPQHKMFYTPALNLSYKDPILCKLGGIGSGRSAIQHIFEGFWHITVIFNLGGEKPVLSIPPSTAELIQHKSPTKIKFQFAENKCGKFQLQGQDSRRANIKDWKRIVLYKTTTNHVTKVRTNTWEQLWSL